MLLNFKFAMKILTKMGFYFMRISIFEILPPERASQPSLNAVCGSPSHPGPYYRRRKPLRHFQRWKCVERSTYPVASSSWAPPRRVRGRSDSSPVAIPGCSPRTGSPPYRRQFLPKPRVGISSDAIRFRRRYLAPENTDYKFVLECIF